MWLTIKLSLELGQDKGHSLGSSGSGGHDVEGSSASPPEVSVGCIQQTLVSGVGVGGGHGSLDNAEFLVQDLQKASKSSSIL